MKAMFTRTANALLDLAEKCDSGECAGLCDAAVRHLCFCGCSAHDLAAFLRAVRRESLKRKALVTVRLTTPSGRSGPQGKRIHLALEGAIGKKLSLEESADDRLMGGAILSRGDDRYDASVRGALDRLAAHFATV